MHEHKCRCDQTGTLRKLFWKAIAQIFQTMPAAKALVENVLRVFRWPDTQSFLGSEADNVFQVMQQQQAQQMEQQQAMADPRMQLLMTLGGAAPGPAGGMMGQPDDPAAGASQGGMVQ